MSAEGCGGHPELSAELRGIAVAVLDRIEPVLDQWRADPPSPAPATCTVCPFCALVAALRGERPEMAVRFAEQAGGIVAVLRAALGEPAPEPPAPPARPVHRIPVTRP